MEWSDRVDIMSREDSLSLEDLEVDASDDGGEVVCDRVFVCAAEFDGVAESGLCVVRTWVEPGLTPGAVVGFEEAAAAVVEVAALLIDGDFDVD